MTSTLAIHTSRRPRIAACAAVVVAFAAPALSLILLGVQQTASYADQVEYHLPTIEQFAQQWPAFDFSSYPAAMTPGYHLLMAALWKLGGSVFALQLATTAITSGLLATLAWVISRRRSAIDTILLCLPIAWSQYVFAAGVWIVPHNLAWWGVLLMLIAATRTDWSPRLAIIGGILLAATVFVRQIHLWAAAGLVTTAAVAGGAKLDRLSERARRVAFSLACCLPAIAVLFYFYRLWGSLAPASQPWAKPAAGINVAAITMVLATFGFLTPLLIARVPQSRRQWLALLAGLVTGFLIALAPPSTYDRDAGRWSGLWNVAGVLGTIVDRSVLITLLASAGGASIGLLLAMVRPPHGWIWSALIAGFIASSAAVNLAWQRYYEPLVLMSSILMLRDVTPTTAQRWLRALLAAIQAGLLLLSLRG